MTEDCRIYNVRNAEGNWLCPACGFAGGFAGPQYTERGGLIGTGICGSCLFEVGFDDHKVGGKPDDQSVGQAIRSYRENWLSGIVEWQGQQDSRPEGWDGREQLERLFQVAPHLR